MKFWDDQLRLCPKCKAAVRMASEDTVECPKCRARVRFYHYRRIPRPPEVPEAAPGRLWDYPKTTALLIATGLVALLALIAIHNRLFVAVALTDLLSPFFCTTMILFMRDHSCRCIARKLSIALGGRNGSR